MKPGAPPSPEVRWRRDFIAACLDNEGQLCGLTNRWLAEGFGVSQKTIENDLAMLRDIYPIEKRRAGRKVRANTV